MKKKSFFQIQNKIRIVILLLISYLCLSGIFHFITPQYTRLYLPFINITLNAAYPEFFQFSPLKIKNEDGTIFCKIRIKGEAIKNGKYVNAELKGNARVKFFFIALYPAIVFSLIICRPNLPWKIRTTACLIASLLVFCITAIDLSFTIMASIEAILAFDNLVQDFRKFIIQFFNNGGRQFCAIIIAWISTILGYWVFE